MMSGNRKSGAESHLTTNAPGRFNTAKFRQPHLLYSDRKEKGGLEAEKMGWCSQTQRLVLKQYRDAQAKPVHGNC